MMVRLVRQELADGSASPVTDQLLRMRPETSTMEFMLWVAQQEGLAPPGPDKEVGGTHTFARKGASALQGVLLAAAVGSLP
jgi:hypothetical protein